MRRLVLFLSVALVASLVPGGIGAGDPAPSERPASSLGLSPLVDGPGPARVDPAVTAAASALPAAASLDLVVSLERPATGRLRSTLAGLGTWSWVFEHVPAAAVRLPVDRLGALTDLEGVLGVYLNEPLHWYLKESAEQLNTPRAWNDLGVTGEGVTVAILDTGIDFNHPDLAPAMRGNVKLVGFGDPGPLIPLEGITNSDTSSGHGTHVAGDVAARGTASEGEYRGTAPGAGLVGIGAGDGLNMFLVLEGLDWAMANRERLNIRVINNSWGSQFEPFDPYDPVHGATRTLAEAGVVVVFANGNDGTEMSMNPYATAPWVLAVAAGDKEGKVASFSSHGIEADTVGLGFVDVDVAGETRRPLDMGLYHPAITVTGDNVVSTRANTTIAPLTAVPSDLQSVPPDRIPWYTTLSGTSMASPEAAGLAALVLEAAPELDPLQVKRVLQITARDIPDAPFHVGGYGYADAGAAVELALRLHGRGADAIRSELDRLQSERDQGVLGRLAHPSHTYAWTVLAPTVVGSRTRQITVPAGTARLKVVSNGGTVPFVGSASYQITVTDAAGTEVASNADSSPSGATVLDVDLTRQPDVAFGEWTVEIFAIGAFGTPSTGADELLVKRLLNVIVSLFEAAGPTCGTDARFLPGGPLAYRFQEDDAGGVAHPTRPGYTHIGVVSDAGLAQRSPARNLAAAFGQASTSAFEPRFTSDPLAAPVTLGGPATVELWVQGPSEAVQGLVSGQLLDVGGATEEKVIGEIPAQAVLAASAAEPTRTQAPLELKAPVTVPAGHRLALVLAVSFVGTSGHTLFFDSDEYPSGLHLTTGQMTKPEGCPA